MRHLSLDNWEVASRTRFLSLLESPSYRRIAASSDFVVGGGVSDRRLVLKELELEVDILSDVGSSNVQAQASKL